MRYYLILCLLLISCAQEEDSSGHSLAEIPEHIAEMENLTVYSPDDFNPDTVEFEREQVFESNDEVFIRGYISNVAVDKQDRVFLSAGTMNDRAIYVFEPDGNYVTTIGRYGKGPGEFLTIVSLKIRNGRLFAYDRMQRKISIFSLEDFSLFEEMILDDSKVSSEKDWERFIPGGELHVLNDQTFLLEAQNQQRRPNENQKFKYYRVTEAGKILPGKLLELGRPQLFAPNFTWSGGGVRTSIPMPEVWPALHRMELDDQKRLWVSAITDSDSTFQWWVLNKAGELLARFQKPGERQKRSGSTTPLFLVKNGYYYSIERDMAAGIERLVKHRIDFKD